MDTGFYREGTLYRTGGTAPLTMSKDLRQIAPEDLRGAEAVVHLAELSNDPLGQLAPNITYDINHKGSIRLAEHRPKSRGTTFRVYILLQCVWSR